MQTINEISNQLAKNILVLSRTINMSMQKDMDKFETMEIFNLITDQCIFYNANKPCKFEACINKNDNMSINFIYINPDSEALSTFLRNNTLNNQSLINAVTLKVIENIEILPSKQNKFKTKLTRRGIVFSNLSLVNKICRGLELEKDITIPIK